MSDPLDLALAEKRLAMAHEELLRVTGMSHYAKRIQGGPPNPPRCSIPADVDRDTDLIIGESLDRLRAALAEIAALRKVRDAARECNPFFRHDIRCSSQSPIYSPECDCGMRVAEAKYHAALKEAP